MGASNSRHVEASTEGGENVRIKYAASSVQGRKKNLEMEDSYAVVPDLDHTTSFFGVYDGHGGAEVALLCARLFHIELRAHPNYQANLNNAMRSVFSRMDELLQQSNEWRQFITPTDSRNWIKRFIDAVIVYTWRCKWGTPYTPPPHTGSSVSVAVARGNRVTVGNVGDSHCVASRRMICFISNAIQLSTDHNPGHRGEKRRIQRAGGKLYLDKYIHYIVIEAERVAGFRAFQAGIPISRSIGDFGFKQNKDMSPEEQMVICSPDIRSMEITDDVEFLIIASYGIWHSMTCQAVVDFVHEELRSGQTDLRVICQRLVHRVQPTLPDTTAILIQFKHGAPNDAEGSEEGSDDQEIKSDASDDQEIKSDASDEQQPFVPDRETISRALEFVRSKQRELGGKS